MVVSTKIHRKIPTFLLAGVLFMERICMAKCAFAFLPLSLHRSNTSLSSKISRTTPTTPTTPTAGLLGSKHEDPFHVAIHPARRKNALNYLDDDILDRRTTLSHITSLATTLAILPPALATEQELASPSPSSTITSSSISSNQSILETRLRENSTTPPTYGMEDTDIRYPPYFFGTFTAISKTTDVYAPCGYELFSGGKAAYDAAVEREVVKGESLSYRARFVASGGNGGGAGIGVGVGVRGVDGVVPSSSSTSSSANDNKSNYGSYIAADREFNAKEIAKAAMGSYSVVDVSVATPNRFSCLLAPPSGTGDLISVDILTIARKAETISPTKFACSEVVRQIVSPASSRAGASTPKLVKEIETISIYDVGSGIDDNNIATGVDLGSIRQIPCRQRTATYLVPSQTDPVALKMWQMSRGRPVDVRFYDVVYTRV